MNNFISFFAQAAAPAENAQRAAVRPCSFSWFSCSRQCTFLMIAPQRKRQKAHAKMLSELKTGDRILTIGGMIGTIANVKEKTFIVRLGDNNKVEFIKSAIQSKADSPDEVPEERKN